MDEESISFRSFMGGNVAFKRWRLYAVLFVGYLGVNSVADLSRSSSGRDVLKALITNLPWALITPLLIAWIDWALEYHRGEQIALCLITFVLLCVITVLVPKPSAVLVPANDQRRTANDHP
jgi:hypothetical protein